MVPIGRSESSIHYSFSSAIFCTLESLSDTFEPCAKFFSRCPMEPLFMPFVKIVSTASKISYPYDAVIMPVRRLASEL